MLHVVGGKTRGHWGHVLPPNFAREGVSPTATYLRLVVGQNINNASVKGAYAPHADMSELVVATSKLYQCVKLKWP